MAYSKRRYKRKETTAQSLARLKRKQETYRKKLEAARKQRLIDNAPGGRNDPLVPKWCSFEKYSEVTLEYRQVRYRGRTRITAYLKGTEPVEHSCPQTGYRKQIEFYDHQWAAWISRLGPVQFGQRWYEHPVSIVSYTDFCKRYTVYEEHERYSD